MAVVYKLTDRKGLSVGPIHLPYNIGEATIAMEYFGKECPLMAFDTEQHADDYRSFLGYYMGKRNFKIYECKAEISTAKPRYIRSGAWNTWQDIGNFWLDYWNNVPSFLYPVCETPAGTVFCKVILPKEIK